MILDCQDPAKLTYESIQMNIRQSRTDLPVFEYKKHYMFYGMFEYKQFNFLSLEKDAFLPARI